MLVYLETSALVGWLLSEPTGPDVIRCLGRAERVLTSRLTIGEARRVLTRAVREGRLSAVDDARVRAELEAQLVGWDVMEVTTEIWSLAEASFAVEPVRMLDAIHLATALRFHQLFGHVQMLSTDERVRVNSRALGLTDDL